MPKSVSDARSIKGKYEIIEHTADIGICVKARSLEKLFAMAACAMFDLMVDISGVKSVERAEISLEADTLEDLLVTWLNELVFRADVSGIFFSRFEVDSVTEKSIRASATGEAYHKDLHSIGEHVKAATYHQLEISRSGGNWLARVIFDV